EAPALPERVVPESLQAGEALPALGADVSRIGGGRAADDCAVVVVVDGAPAVVHRLEELPQRLERGLGLGREGVQLGDGAAARSEGPGADHGSAAEAPERGPRGL